MRISENKTDFQNCFRSYGVYYFHAKVVDITTKGVRIKFRYADESVLIVGPIVNRSDVLKGQCYIIEIKVPANKWPQPTWAKNTCQHRFVFNTTSKVSLVNDIQ